MRNWDWQTYYEHQIARIESAMQSLIAGEEIHPRLREAMLYSLLAGGKRLRPAMVLLAAEALEGDSDAALPIACAIEMVHTYSLVHDDLPAMDNDDYRRGLPTNHKVYGEATAILAGDALLTQAFRTISTASLKPETIVSIIRELSYYAGPCGMVGGQAADMDGQQGVTSLEQLEYIHTHKTGDLIVCSLRAGGHVANASPEQLDALERFGRCLGLAFQIQDDILDVTGDESKLGKSAGSDEKHQKVTYPYFLGIEASRERVRQLTEEGIRAISDGILPYPDRLLGLSAYLMVRDH